MPTLVNLTFDVADLIGADFDVRRTKVWIETNIPSGSVIDTTGKVVRLGDVKATVGADGKGTFTGLFATNSADLNPTGFLYQVYVDYATRADGRKLWASGWFALTATSDLATVTPVANAPVNTTDDAVIASRVNDPASQTRAAADKVYVRPSGKTTTTAAAPLPWVNPLDKGAKFDGVTDDTAALQAAINSGYCDLPPGTAMYTTLTFPNGVCIRGAGFGKTILKQIAGTAQPLLAPVARGLTNCRIEAFTLSAGANAVGTVGLSLDGVAESYIDLDITNYAPVGISLSGLSNGDTMRNTIRGKMNNFFANAVLFNLANFADANDIDMTLQNSGTGSTIIKGRGTGPNYYNPSACKFKTRGFSSVAVTAIDWEGNASTFDGTLEANGNITAVYTANSLGDNDLSMVFSPVGGTLVYTDNSVARPNLRRDSAVNGTTVKRIHSLGHVRGAGRAPVLSGAHVNLASSAILGTDTAGRITLTTDATGIGAFAALITVTFVHAFDTAPVVLLTPQSAAGAGQWQAFNVTATSFQLTTTSPLAASTAYPVAYMVIEPR